MGEYFHVEIETKGREDFDLFLPGPGRVPRGDQIGILVLMRDVTVNAS